MNLRLLQEDDNKTTAEKRDRQESAFFWGERNKWFSDVWMDLKGTGQELVEKSARSRHKLPGGGHYALSSRHDHAREPRKLLTEYTRAECNQPLQASTNGTNCKLKAAIGTLW